MQLQVQILEVEAVVEHDPIELSPLDPGRKVADPVRMGPLGEAAAEAFGPVMRFVYGTDFTSRRLTRHILRGRKRLRLREAGVREWRCRG